MTADARDLPCDSLSGASFAAHALSVPPNGRAARRPTRFQVLAGLASVAAITSAVFGSIGQRGAPAVTPEAPRVNGQTVSFSANYAVQAGIRLIEVRQTDFFPVISGAGTASLDPHEMAAVGASALGTVRRVAKYEGDSVKRGEVLAEIHSLPQARREAAASFSSRELPRSTLGISEVRSPLDGTVVERRVVTGQSVRGERVVFVVANLDRLALELLLDDAQALEIGDRVELSRDAAPGLHALGQVIQIAKLNEPGRRFGVSIRIDNRARSLRPGQAVSARLFASGATRALLVPNRALAWIAGRPAVFVADGPNSVSAADVTLGGGDGEQTEVRQGLRSGQRIVSDGVSTLKEASFL